jgi:hypothetical protein
VITDSKSSSPKDNLKAAGKLSIDDGIKVIAFGIGRDTDGDELMTIASEKDDVVNANTTDKPIDSNKVIMDRVLGRLPWVPDILLSSLIKLPVRMVC